MNGALKTLALLNPPLAPAHAADTIETDIMMARASVLMERASDGLGRLRKSRKVHIAPEWADELQNKAADLCSFIKEKIENEHVGKKSLSLCAVE